LKVKNIIEHSVVKRDKSHIIQPNCFCSFCFLCIWVARFYNILFLMVMT